MELCLPCLKNVLTFRRKTTVYESDLLGIVKRPEKYKLCLACEQRLDIERYLYKHRLHVSRETRKEKHALNCIEGCGYGMFAPKFYKKHVIDKRRT